MKIKKLKKQCKPYPKEKENKTHSADYNCSNCNQTDCFYWHLYNKPDV